MFSAIFLHNGGFMMRRMLWIAGLILVGLTLVACDLGGKTNSGIDEVLELMEADGYVFDERDADSIQYYEDNMINTKFDVDLDVIEVYLGYVDQTERWAEVVVFASEEEANEYKIKLVEEAVEGRLIVLRDSVVILTFSGETAALFTESKTN